MKARTFLGVMFILGVLMYSAPSLRSQVPSTGTASTVTQVPGQIAPPAPGAPTQPAIAVTTVPSPASPQNPLDAVMWAGAASYVIRYLTKKSWFPLLSAGSSSQLKTQFGFVVALLTAAGIRLAVNGSFFSQEGVGFTMTGLSAHAVKDVGFQWLSQQTWYDLIVKRLQQEAAV